MKPAVLTYALSVMAAVAVTILTARGETSPLVWAASVLGAATAIAAGAFGRASIVYAGVAAMLGAFAVTLTTGSSDAFDTLVVALLTWLHVELQMRSMELRPAYRPQRTASLGWLGSMTTIAAVTIALWFTIGLIETSARPGGVVFRVLAVVLVVAVALLVSGLPWRSGFPGSGGTRQ